MNCINPAGEIDEPASAPTEYQFLSSLKKINSDVRNGGLGAETFWQLGALVSSMQGEVLDDVVADEEMELDVEVTNMVSAAEIVVASSMTTE